MERSPILRYARGLFYFEDKMRNAYALRMGGGKEIRRDVC